MGKVYNGQSKLKIRLDSKVDVSGATTKRIKYSKPGGTTGYFNASVEADNQTIYYAFQDGDIDESGVWTFWPYVVFSDGRDAPGESVEIKFYTEGEG